MPVTIDDSVYESVLNSVKKLLNIHPSETAFDLDVIVHVNSTFMTINQLGAGSAKPFTIDSAAQKWNDFLTDRDDLALIKSYVYLKVRLLFDPPSNASLYSAIEKQLGEYEWRINHQAESETNHD